MRDGGHTQGTPMDDKIEVVDKSLGVFEKLVNFFKRYSIYEILKTLILTILVGYAIYFSLNPDKVFDAYERWKKARHTEAIELSMANNIQIQSEIDRLRERLGADRVILLSYHNSKQSLAGVPYIYLTAINESIAYNIAPVAEGYEAVKTSLYPFVTYLSANGEFCGDICDLRDIDKALAYRMEGNDVQHFAAVNIEGTDPLGMIFVTFTLPVDENHKCDLVMNDIRRTAMKIGILLDNEDNTTKKKR